MISRLHVAWLSRLSVGAVLAVILSIGMLAGPATAAAPVYMNSDGNCATPPSSSRTIDLSNFESPFVVIDYGRSRLTQGNITWQLLNLDTGLVQFSNLGAGALLQPGSCGPYAMHFLYDDYLGPLFGSDLSLARYKLILYDSTVGVTKNLRFSVVP